MADGITVDILGNKAILDNLAAFGIETVARAQGMLEKAGETALEIADELAPVGDREYERDGEEHPGYLKSRNMVDAQPGVVTVSNDAPYAIPVVTGHRTRGNTFVAPNDFLTPAMQQAGQQLLSDLENLV